MMRPSELLVMLVAIVAGCILATVLFRKPHPAPKPQPAPMQTAPQAPIVKMT